MELSSSAPPVSDTHEAEAARRPRPAIGSALQQLLRFVVRRAAQRILHARLRRRGATVARSAMFIGRCQITGPIEIGEESIVFESVVDGRGGVAIGRRAIINRATIITAQHDVDSPAFETQYAPVRIGDYAVVFTGAIILPGTTIGPGAVVAAGAVVAGAVPSMAIVAGNPARTVRYRASTHGEIDLRRIAGFAPRRLHTLRERLGARLSFLAPRP